MTSAAKLAANRQNAQKSTGPRTPEGKARASRNARKHGLAAAAREPDRLEKITTLAAALAEGSTDWDVRAYTHSVAEAEFDLQQVWEARVLEHEAAGPGFSNKERSPAGWTLKLSRLERYERRAFSRRKRAIRWLEAAKAGPRPGSPLVECGRRVIAEFWQNEAIGAACHSCGENWQDDANEAPSDISQNEAIGMSGQNSQNEATGAFNENWRNEPNEALAEKRHNDASRASGDVPKKLEAAVPPPWPNTTSVVSPTTGGTQSAGVWQDEATEPIAGDATPEAGGPEASAAPKLASRAPATRSDPMSSRCAAPPAIQDSARGTPSGAPATGPPRCANPRWESSPRGARQGLAKSLPWEP